MFITVPRQTLRTSWSSLWSRAWRPSSSSCRTRWRLTEKFGIPYRPAPTSLIARQIILANSSSPPQTCMVYFKFQVPSSKFQDQVPSSKSKFQVSKSQGPSSKFKFKAVSEIIGSDTICCSV